MTKLKLTSRLLCTLILATALIACGDKGIKVTSQFANTQDIKTGTAVYFDSKVIGEVVEVNAQNDGLLATIELDKSAGQLIASNSAIVVNRLQEGSPLEIHNPTNMSSNFVQDGQQIQALDSIFQLGAWMVGDAIQLGSDTLNDYVSAFQEYLQGEEYQQDKALVQDQINLAGQETQAALKSVEAELTQAFEQLSSSEEDVAQLIQQLGEDLSPMVEEIAKSGTELAKQLEQFTQGLQQTDDNDQVAGQMVLNSLLSMLEQLNQSIEQGAEQGLDESTQ